MSGSPARATPEAADEEQDRVEALAADEPRRERPVALGPQPPRPLSHEAGFLSLRRDPGQRQRRHGGEDALGLRRGAAGEQVVEKAGPLTQQRHRQDRLVAEEPDQLIER